MAEAFPEDLESSVEREVLETAPNAPIQWGRLIACLPQLDSIDLIQPSLKLGRCDECDIVIHKSKFLPKHLFFVSKEHFLITRDPDDNYITYITDLSKNGTYVNGELIGKDNKIILQNNNIIAIGEKLPVYIFKSMTYLVPGDYLPKILRKRYEPSYFLGIGACGEVRLVYDRLSCQKYAIKKIVKGKDTLSQIDRLNHPMRIQVEIDIMSTVLHPFVVRMHEIVSTELEVYLILEYVDGGELGRRIMGQNPLTESATKFLFYQLVLAVQYLHSRGITHRDLKPANVLLTTKDSMPVIKLSDFGLSKLSDGYDMMKTICGTWHFIAPEVLNPAVEEYGMQVDVWSLGITLFYMLSKELPFQARDRSTLGQLIINGTYNMSRPSWIEISPSAKDLVRRMLLVDPRQRITISGILNHPWIAQRDAEFIQARWKDFSDLIMKRIEQIYEEHNYSYKGIESFKLLQSYVVHLEEENENLKRELRQKSVHNIDIDFILSRSNLLNFYTNFSDVEKYNTFVDIVKSQAQWFFERYHTRRNEFYFKLDHRTQIFLVLSRLRLGLLEQDLAIRYNVNVATISRIIMFWLKVIYPNTRVILDGTEIFIETPSDYVIQSSTYSVYKSHNTAKGVMGITHNGFVSFVTDLFPGRTSDRDFVIRSGLIENLDPGDSVMADRGFTIEEELRAVDCELNVPPFLEGVSQFNIENEQATRDIASIRIHVERKIREVKSYRILHSTVPNTLSDQLNKIWTDHLMQYQVDNLLVSFNYTGIRSKRATEEKGFLNQVKRIRLSSSSGEPSV